MMRYCTQCGAQNEDDSLFCPNCGQRLRPIENEVKPVQTWGTPSEDEEAPIRMPGPQKEPVAQRVEFVPAHEVRRVRPYRVYRTRESCHSGSFVGSLVGFVFFMIAIMALLAIFAPAFFGGFGEFGGHMGTVFGELGRGLGEFFGRFGGEMGHMGSEFGSNFGNWSFSAFPWKIILMVIVMCCFIIPGLVVVFGSRHKNDTRNIR
ncbi:MAG: zinc-ribbon domain-containing protein [Candidatus Heimdallarchaeota archaeon]